MPPLLLELLNLLGIVALFGYCYWLGRAHPIRRLRDAEASIERVRTLAEQMAARVPANDWGETIAETLTADVGRAFLAALDHPDTNEAPKECGFTYWARAKCRAPADHTESVRVHEHGPWRVPTDTTGDTP